MDQLSDINRKSEVNILVTPVITIFGKKDFLFNLSDSVYGEWIVFEGDDPKYYLNIFDKTYDPIREVIESSNENIGDVLNCKFKEKNLNLVINRKVWGIVKKNQSFLRIYNLEKLPPSYFN